MSDQEKVEIINDFLKLINSMKSSVMGELIYSQDLRDEINRKKRAVKNIVLEYGCHKTYIISPPPAIGGPVVREVDPFEYIFEKIYGKSLVPALRDMLNEAIGCIVSGDVATKNLAKSDSKIRKGYAFVAMIIDDGVPEAEDLLDSIKMTCADLEIVAERIDDQKSSERITDRIIESIKSAEYVIVDLTHQRLNVYYEAGFAYGVGKTPIYIAKHGTKLEFDIKDYPIIFFRNFAELRSKLTERLLAVRSAH
ncbi:MAG: hypothetical protein ACK4NV_18840 [Pannonibacter sp.]